MSFEHYLLPWPVMIIYGTLIAIAASGVGVLFIWAVGAVSGVFFTRLIPVINALAGVIAFYLIGSWVGARCDQRRFFTVVSIVLLYALAAALAGLFLSTSSLTATLATVASTTTLYFVMALLGLWRGDRARFTTYFKYLLNFLPAHARPMLVNTAYEEVERLLPAESQEVPRTLREEAVRVQPPTPPVEV